MRDMLSSLPVGSIACPTHSSINIIVSPVKRFRSIRGTCCGRCINAVFESWLNPRAVAYRGRHGLDAVSGTGVTVQAMFPSEVSGVLFTQDPTDFAAERMIVESAYGLGESIVSGDLTPDRFRVSRHDFGDFETHIGHKASAVGAGRPLQAEPRCGQPVAANSSLSYARSDCKWKSTSTIPWISNGACARAGSRCCKRG